MTEHRSMTEGRDSEHTSAAIPGAGLIRGLTGVLIWTEAARFDTLRDFYRDTLGLSVYSEKPQFVNFDWALADGQRLRLTIAAHSEIEGVARDPLRIMLNLGVDGIHACTSRLIEAGVPCVRPPARESWGWVATFTDPDGNIVQLIEADG